MEPKEKLKLIKEAMDACYKGELSELSTLVVIKSIIEPSKITPDIKEWAIKRSKKWK